MLNHPSTHPLPPAYNQSFDSQRFSMFDVSWADPGNSETVGQRKQRKEQQQNSARNGSEQPIREGLVRSSKSEKSSASQFKPSFMSFFGQNYRKTVPKRGDPQLSLAKAPPSIIQTAPVEEAKKDRAMSSYTIDESTTQELPPESLAGVLRADFVGSTYLSDSETDPSDSKLHIRQGSSHLLTTLSHRVHFLWTYRAFEEDRFDVEFGCGINGLLKRFSYCPVVESQIIYNSKHGDHSVSSNKFGNGQGTCEFCADFFDGHNSHASI